MAAVNIVIVAGLLAAGSAHAEEVTLTKDEAETLRMIVSKDKMMKNLIAAEPGLTQLGKLLHSVATGPVKIAVQWDQTAIEGAKPTRR